MTPRSAATSASSSCRTRVRHTTLALSGVIAPRSTAGKQPGVGAAQAGHLGYQSLMLGRRHRRASRLGNVLDWDRTVAGSTTARMYRFRTSRRMFAATALGRRSMR